MATVLDEVDRHLQPSQASRTIEREIPYEWDCADGHFDFVAKMNLLVVVTLDAAFHLDDIRDATCEVIEIVDDGKVIWTERYTGLTKAIELKFMEHYRRDVCDLQDAVQDVACQKLAAEMAAA